MSSRSTRAAQAATASAADATTCTLLTPAGTTNVPSGPGENVQVTVDPAWAQLDGSTAAAEPANAIAHSPHEPINTADSTAKKASVQGRNATDSLTPSPIWRPRSHHPRRWALAFSWSGPSRSAERTPQIALNALEAAPLGGGPYEPNQRQPRRQYTAPERSAKHRDTSDDAHVATATRTRRSPARRGCPKDRDRAAAADVLTQALGCAAWCGALIVRRQSYASRVARRGRSASLASDGTRVSVRVRSAQ